MSKAINVGDAVKVKGTNHSTIVKDVLGRWVILKEKLPSHCCNYYSIDELEITKKDNKKEIPHG